MSRAGLFITFEGVEGCGKSTQIALLARDLENRGRDVVVTREPGGTPVAEAIRSVLLDPANTGMKSTTELLLYAAARAQHVEEVIRPALSDGKIVLCDRYADSTTAYQGAGRGLSMELLKQLHTIATGGTWPDLTVVIDVPAEVGLARAAGARQRDRIEQEAVSFHESVRAGFLSIAAESPDRVKVVDGTRPVDEVRESIKRLVDLLLERDA